LRLELGQFKSWVAHRRLHKFLQECLLAGIKEVASSMTNVSGTQMATGTCEMEGFGQSDLSNLSPFPTGMKECASNGQQGGAMTMFDETYRVIAVEEQSLTIQGNISGEVLTIVTADPDIPLTEEDYRIGQLIALSDPNPSGVN
jgi:hypothetical protein